MIEYGRRCWWEVRKVLDNKRKTILTGIRLNIFDEFKLKIVFSI